MFRLSETERIKAKADALRAFAARADGALADRLSSRGKKEEAILALMSIHWALSLVQKVGPEMLRKLLGALQQRCFHIGRMQDIPGHVSPRDG